MGKPENTGTFAFSLGAAFAFLLTTASCAHRPIEELVLADVAVKAAQKVKADALAPEAYRRAENYYLRAKKDFAEGYFDSCRRFADEARVLAEQAEYRALLKQNQSKVRSEDEGGGQPPPPPPPSPAAGGGPEGYPPPQEGPSP